MAEKPAETESKKMELLDLTDDALIHIFSYLDHYSQLEAMLVCRRFELLIGQNVQFYKNYKLNLEKNWYHGTFSCIRRYFKEVCLSRCSFSPGNKLFLSLMQTFEVIGPKIIKLEIKRSEGYKMPFLDFLTHANNVKELSIALNINSNSIKYKEVDLQQLTFPDLKFLELINTSSFRIFDEVFHRVNCLQHLKLAIDGYEYYNRKKDWRMCQQILMRQENLRSLELNHVVIDDFEWRSWDIEKLALRGVRFLNKEAFKKFTDFVKTLSNIQELRLDLEYDERLNRNNYTEILSHLLNLPSLRILKLNCLLQLNLRIKNPTMSIFIVDDPSISLGAAASIFPNIQRVEFISVWEVDREDLFVLAYLKSLIELKFFSISVQPLLSIKCSQLRRISALQPFFEKPSMWKTFGENNPNIEFLELSSKTEVKSRVYDNKDQEHLIHILGYLPKLKLLKLHQRSIPDEDVLHFVGEKFIRGHLELLEMSLGYSDPAPIAVFNKSNFPQLRCDSRKLGHDQWLITIRKY